MFTIYIIRLARKELKKILEAYPHQTDENPDIINEVNIPEANENNNQTSNREEGNLSNNSMNIPFMIDKNEDCLNIDPLGNQPAVVETGETMKNTRTNSVHVD